MKRGIGFAVLGRIACFALALLAIGAASGATQAAMPSGTVPPWQEVGTGSAYGGGISSNSGDSQ